MFDKLQEFLHDIGDYIITIIMVLICLAVIAGLCLYLYNSTLRRNVTMTVTGAEVHTTTYYQTYKGGDVTITVPEHITTCDIHTTQNIEYSTDAANCPQYQPKHTYAMTVDGNNTIVSSTEDPQ